MSDPVNINIPPIPAIPDDATKAQAECYYEKILIFTGQLGDCFASGGGAAVVQACVTSAHNSLIAQLGYCDTL